MKKAVSHSSSVNLTEKLTVPALLLFFSVGAAGMLFRETRPMFILMIPYVIILSTVVSFIYHKPAWGFRTVLIFILIAFFSWGIEYAGVSSGKIFGTYSYGPGLGLSPGGTPLIIGINWLLLVYCTAAMTESITNPFLQVIASSVLMVVYDIILEIAAPALNMWEFNNGSAPWNNYAAWFLISVFLHSMLRLAGIRIFNRVAQYVFIIQFMFFLVISFLLYNKQ